MARITFDPKAMRQNVHILETFLPMRNCRYHIHGDGCAVASVSDVDFPCDLTLPGHKPHEWARAVYEAGVRRGKPLGAAEHLALFGTGMPPPAKGYGKSYTETLLGGVTQQPAKTPFEPKTCYVCGKARRSAFDGWCMSDGRWVCHSACADAPRQPLPSIIINGTEYRPVTDSQPVRDLSRCACCGRVPASLRAASMVHGCLFCGGCAVDAGDRYKYSTDDFDAWVESCKSSRPVTPS